MLSRDISTFVSVISQTSPPTLSLIKGCSVCQYTHSTHCRAMVDILTWNCPFRWNFSFLSLLLSNNKFFRRTALMGNMILCYSVIILDHHVHLSMALYGQTFCWLDGDPTNDQWNWTEDCIVCVCMYVKWQNWCNRMLK
jgi:hypothetical protein